MASIINASSTLGLISTADTSGVLQLQTANTTAVTVNANQTVSLAVGTANGVTYLNGSKVLTSGSALTFDGTNLGVGISPTTTLDVAGPVRSRVISGVAQLYLNNGATQLSIDNNSGNMVFTLAAAAEQMRLTSTGLGIGTSSPAYKLDVVVASNKNVVAFAPSSSSGISDFSSGGVGWNFSRPDDGALRSSIYSYNTSGGALNNFVIQARSDLVFTTGGDFSNAVERMRIDSSGNVGIGTTSPANPTGGKGFEISNASGASIRATNSATYLELQSGGSANYILSNGAYPLLFYTNGSERARIDSSGNLLVGTTNTNPGGSDINGIALRPGNFTVISALGVTPFGINRGTDDGTLINFSQAGTTEGTISVSGTTVSYNGGHLSRYAQTTTAKDNSLVKGTVLSNLDEMNVYTKDGQPVDNEQLNKVKVSDTEGDVNVAGVFVNWSHDDDHNVDEINMAMTGDMIIRIAQGVTVVRGDLLMSAGDGTAKPQGDDIIRSKTVAKVTSNHVTCTYADGSYCVPCVLMAC